MAVNHSIPRADSDLMELPEFELNFAFDDDEAPRWVTVYSGDEDDAVTEWISMTIEHVVDLDQIA